MNFMRMDSQMVITNASNIDTNIAVRAVTLLLALLLLPLSPDMATSTAAAPYQSDLKQSDLNDQSVSPYGQSADHQMLDRLESLPEPPPHAITAPAPTYAPQLQTAPQQPWTGGPRQFVIPPFGRQPDIQFDIEDGRISLVARSAPLRDVLSLLAEKHGLNLVMAQDAVAPITITLNRVTLMDALEAVVSVAGYTWTTHRGIVHVSSISSSNSLTPHVQGRLTRVFELDYVAAIDLDLAIKGMLSPSGRSEVMLSDTQDNRRTREVIVVEDFPAFIHRIEQYVAQVDVSPRQVLIQVHVLQIDLDHSERHGINLENLIRLGGGNIRINTVGLANAVAGQAIFAEINGTDVDALLEALETHTDSETLASPRLVALNGQESRLQVGERLGYRTSTTTETSTQETISFLDVGVVLNVTPRITRDDNVLMYIRPEVSSGQVSESTGLPSESTSEVETNLILRSGQGIVIGGLIQERDTFEETQAPILGNIKGLGHLFKRRSNLRERSEIVFVLVPHILPPGCGPDSWHGDGELISNSNKVHKIDFDQRINCGGNGQYQSGSGATLNGNYQQQNYGNAFPAYNPQPQTIHVSSNDNNANALIGASKLSNRAASLPTQANVVEHGRVGKSLFNRINPFDSRSKRRQHSRSQQANHRQPSATVVQTGFEPGKTSNQVQNSLIPNSPVPNSVAQPGQSPDSSFNQQYQLQIEQQNRSFSRTAGGVSFSFSDKQSKSRR